ncbi:MAG: zinc carboxypeptidase [Halobacteriovoraceae bacterium]|nr:zinc carboxypeptidase [Halobacteriovoraceae bacterium]MBT5095575.1 zinc carboxypeptidase [Halobacteriovoraceae bacterium]
MKLALLLLTLLAQTALAGTHHFVQLDVQTTANRTKIANLIHMDQVIDGVAYSVVNQFDFDQLQKKVPKLIQNSHPMSEQEINGGRTPRPGFSDYEFPKGDEKFHTYDEVNSSLAASIKKYPSIATALNFGTTLEGKTIHGIRITKEGNRKSPYVTPGILFVGAHHAREHLSTEAPMGLIKYLLENYGTNARVTKLIDNRDIYIVPMLNSDGAMYDIKGRKYKMWRKNRRKNSGSSFGVDLNRNYSFGWGTGGSSRNPRSDVFMGPAPFSEPETMAVKKFVEEHSNLRMLLSYHTFSELILYPWGGKNEGVGGKDQETFVKMAKQMATHNKYKPMQASGLYIATGDTCDWAYGTQGIFCFTFELSPKSRWRGGFYPGAKVIDRVTKVNIIPALEMIEWAGDPYAVLRKRKGDNVSNGLKLFTY